MCVHGFLRDIAQDDDYDIYAVNNWWDDLEKFGAVNARFLAVRHGIRFEVTFATEQSWDACECSNGRLGPLTAAVTLTRPFANSDDPQRLHGAEV